MQDHHTKLNNRRIILPESVITVIDDLETTGKKQLKTFVSDRLVVSKMPNSQKESP